MLLAKNPAGWQEALSMVDKRAAGVVISINGQVPDGEDLSWLWDVRFEHFEQTEVVAAGERGTDLAVRLGYAGSSTPWCTTPSPRSRRAHPGGLRLSPITPRSSSCNERWRAVADSTVRIGLVLPDVMGTYGDGGNALVLRQRLLLRGIPAEIVEITLADPVPESLDLYTLGGAEDYAQRLATRHLIKHLACSAPRNAARRCWRSARPSRCSGTGTRPRPGNAWTAWACWTRRRRRKRRAPSASWRPGRCWRA